MTGLSIASLGNISGDNEINSDYNRYYDKDSYRQHAVGMSNSAEVILGLIYNLYNPKSIIDIGCGQGAWLNAAESFGATTLKGLDGYWVKKKTC